MEGQTKNQLLMSVEQAAASKVPPEQKDRFEKIVLAGMKIMYSPETSEMMQSQLKKEGDPTENAGEGAAKLFGILMHESKGTMPMAAAIPAMQVLLCEGLDYMEQAGLIQVTNDVIAEATKAMMGYILQMVGVKKEQMNQYMQAGMDAGDAKSGAPGAVQAAQPTAPQGIVSGAMAQGEM